MKIEIEDSRELSVYVKYLKKVVNDAHRDAVKLLPIKDVKVFIRHDPSSVILELGVGGYTPDGNEVRISVDAQQPKFIRTVIPSVYRTLLHEFHHTARWRGPGYGKTLFEALVTEGLADHFELEVTNKSLQPWDKALSAKDIKALLTRAGKELGKEYSHSDWFYGSKKRKIPRWTGYSLGFSIVGEYLKNNPDKKPSSLYSSNAQEYRKNIPVLYIMCGLPFSGKSTLAQKMYEENGWKIVSIDHIKAKKGLRDTWKGMNVSDWRDIFAEAEHQTENELCKGRSVIYDSTNHTKQSRDKLRRIAKKCKCTSRVIFADVSPKTAKSRWMTNKDSNKRMDLPEWAFQAVIRDWESPTKDELSE